MRTLSVLSAALALASVVGSASAQPAPAKIAWGDDITAAMRDSARSAKPVIVDVWAVWCKPCKEMDETTYRDPAVVGAASGLVPLKVDADVQATFIERYAIDAYPTVLFLDEEGTEIARLVGKIPAARMKRAMEVVSTGYAGFRASVARGDDPDALAGRARYLSEAGNPAAAADLLSRALDLSESAAPGVRATLGLDLAQARLDAGDSRRAAELFERLSREAPEPSQRSQALRGVVVAERARGRKKAAAAALERLQREFPEMVERLGTSAPR